MERILLTVVILCLACSTGCSLPQRQAVRIEYVKQQVPALPSPPEYYPVKFTVKDGFYCFDSVKSAKGFLKNRELDKGYQGEQRSILTNLKEGSK